MFILLFIARKIGTKELLIKSARIEMCIDFSNLNGEKRDFFYIDFSPTFLCCYIAEF